MTLILLSTLAKAYELYGDGIKVCHFIIMGNHLHLLIIVKSPDAVAAFMNYLKMETAHAVNKLLARRKRTVWEDGYDAVSILTVNDAIEKIAYIYTNPQKANLVEKIEEYPGVSSWKMFSENKLSIEVPRIARPSIEPRCSVESLTEASLGKTASFTLSPNSWIPLLYEGTLEESEIQEINTKIHERVRQIEAEYQNTRQVKQIQVLGAKRLSRQAIDKPYSPSKFSKRMWCICKDLELRASFINSIKALIDSAKKVYNLWKTGDTKVRYPVGMFPPRFPRLVNPYRAALANT